MGILDFTLRLLTGLVLGAAIGLERHWRQKRAGLRTNTLVSLGATAFMLLSIEIGGDASARVASYIISGIGFLGAGVIMKDGLNVQGLNTAATIWCSAAVGSLSGMGKPRQALVLTAVIMLTHLILRPIGRRLSKLTFTQSTDMEIDYLFTIVCKPQIENQVRVLLMQMLGNEDDLLLQSLSSDDTEDSDKVSIQSVIKTASPQDGLIERVASRLTIEEHVAKVSWEIIGTQSDL